MTNRAFAGMAFLGGFLVPLAARFSSRLSFLLRRTRIELPRGLVIPAFAVATVFANPPGNHRAVLDEQQVISVLAILGLLGLLLEAYRRQAPPRETWALLFVTATVVVMKAIHLWLGSYWPRGNYVEEVKEFYLAIGFLGYAVVLVRVYGRPVPLFSARIIPRREPRRGQRRVRAFRAP